MAALYPMYVPFSATPLGYCFTHPSSSCPVSTDGNVTPNVAIAYPFSSPPPRPHTPTLKGTSIMVKQKRERVKNEQGIALFTILSFAPHFA